MTVRKQTAYDYRRYIELVQVLAIEDFQKRHAGIAALRIAWLGDDGKYLVFDRLIMALARHVIEHHRFEDSDARS